MPKFRFIIVDPEADTIGDNVVGTNDERVAKQFAADESIIVVDTEEGKWISSKDFSYTIPEQTVYKLD